MKSKNDYINLIDEKFEQIKQKILLYSQNISTDGDLHDFYDNCLNEFYSFMPFYSFKLANDLCYSQFLEVNQYALQKSNELHGLYTRLFNEKKDSLE